MFLGENQPKAYVMRKFTALTFTYKMVVLYDASHGSLVALSDKSESAYYA